jgi:hypothetical protein
VLIFDLRFNRENFMVGIKGSAVRDTLSMVQERLGDQGYRRILDLLDEETRRVICETRILPTAWIPLDQFVSFLKAEVTILYDGDAESLVAASERLIERHLHGIYRLFIRLSRPESIIEKIAAIHVTYFNGVQIERKLEKNSGTIRYTGFEKQHRLMEFAIRGFYQKALQLCGAKQVKTEFTTHIDDNAGFAELALTWT